MSEELYSLIRYLRIKEGVTQELLAKKLGISKSHLSLIERNKRSLYVDDFKKALNYLGGKILILKNGDDCMKKMNSELAKKELNLTDCGYSRDYMSKTDEAIRVEFDTFTGKVVVAKDMLDTSKYLSEEKHSLYEMKYDENNDGYGRFFREYYDSFDGHWQLLIKLNDNNELITFDLLSELFDEDTINNIENTFKSIMSI